MLYAEIIVILGSVGYYKWDVISAFVKGYFDGSTPETVDGITPSTGDSAINPDKTWMFKRAR